MIIDTHVHCAFFKDILKDSEEMQFRRDQYGLHKTGPASLEQQMNVMNFGKIDKSILLPLDLTTISGKPLVSNDEVRKLVNLAPKRWIGFASVDPNRDDAEEELERAFSDLKLSGLKLNLSRLRMDPMDLKLQPLYKLCLKYNKPVTFHAGMSYEPDAPSFYGQPWRYEELAMAFPDMRFCLAHLGWPWVNETVMLLIKYPNVYTDTSCLYMDTPKKFFSHIFTKELDAIWLEQNFLEKVMFGSNAPRFRPARIKDGLESLEFMHHKSLKKILGGNALVFLGMEEN